MDFSPDEKRIFEEHGFVLKIDMFGEKYFYTFVGDTSISVWSQSNKKSGIKEFEVTTVNRQGSNVMIFNEIKPIIEKVKNDV